MTQKSPPKDLPTQHLASPLWRLVPRKSGPITALTNGAIGPAFYCIHSLGGEVTDFCPLARLLGPEQKIYGIQAPIENLNAKFAASVESMPNITPIPCARFNLKDHYCWADFRRGRSLPLRWRSS